MRWKSKRAWVVTFTFIIFILKTYLQIEIPKSDELINGLLMLGIVWGIFDSKEA